MLKYTAKRLLSAIPLLFGISVIAFIVIHALPGDPILLLANRYELTGDVRQAIEGGSGLAAEQITQIEALRRSFGLDDPLPIQYWNFISGALQGDLGDSVLRGRPVTDLLGAALPHTFRLAGLAIVVSVVLGVGLGLLSALRYKSLLDQGTIFGSLLAVSMPEFLLAILAILFFSVQLGWFPSSGASTWLHLVLPALVLGIRSAGSIARMTRSTTLEALGRGYVTTARAKGLSEGLVVRVHALRNAVIPVITLIGLELGRLLSGTVVVETIFARPGLGKVLIDSIEEADARVLQGAVLVIAVIYVVVNLLVDLSYAAMNPRIRYE